MNMNFLITYLNIIYANMNVQYSKRELNEEYQTYDCGSHTPTTGVSWQAQPRWWSEARSE